MKCCRCLFTGERETPSNEGDGKEKQVLLSSEVQSGREHTQGNREEKIPSLLLHTLDDLSSDDLKRFHFHLNQGSLLGYNPIPRKDLEKADQTDTVDVMLKHYGRDRALEVTLQILRKMNLNQQALTLERKIGTETTEGQRSRQMAVSPNGLTQGDTTDQGPNLILTSNEADELLLKTKKKLQKKLREQCECIFEGIARQGKRVPLRDIFIDIYITEGESPEVNNEHEVRQIEALSKKPAAQETAIGYNDIFNNQSGNIRRVLTKGFAGIGKTVSVQKFILDWAEGKANKDISLIFPLPFRELNLMKERSSLLQLIQHYNPEMKGCESINLNNRNVLFIFDGLDECRLPLDFQNNGSWYDVTEPTSVDVLLTNLIQGNLLPSALVWITSRPTAANQIPPECVHRMTEVRGFKDEQKEEYFKKRFGDVDLANKIISHIKSARSLYIMCHIPVFCWISATVLEDMFGDQNSEQGVFPKTLTEMYTLFLRTQTAIKSHKFEGHHKRHSKESKEEDLSIIQKLGKLAFQNLAKNNLIFDLEDLRKCDIDEVDISKALVYFGVCTEVVKEERGLYQNRMYCFVHLTIQEYFAALYAVMLCTGHNINTMHQEPKQTEDEPSSEEEDFSENDDEVVDEIEADNFPSSPLSELHRSAVDQALQSKNGHLDLFLRFLLGLSLDSNQKHLRGLLTQTGSTSQSIKETVRHIKEKIRKNPSPERTINLFHCLNELQDHSLVEKIQSYLHSNKKLTPDQCSAVAYILLMSERELDNLDLMMYNTTAAGRGRLLPVVKFCKKARLYHCNLTEESCGAVLSALHSPRSQLEELDLSFNDLEDSGVKPFCVKLTKPQCKLTSLSLVCCRLTEASCDLLASALQSGGVRLKKLDLSCNNLGDEGVKRLCAGVPTLVKLGLRECNLTESCCDDLARILRSSELRDLELRDNDLQDSGVTALSAGLEDTQSELQRLGLSGCRVTERGCVALASALRSNPSHLRELDLSYNHPGGAEATLLSAELEELLLDHCGECRNKPGLWKYACQLSLDPNTAGRELHVSEGDRKVTRLEEEEPSIPDHPDRFDWPQVLCREGLSEDRCYWEMEWSGRDVQVGVAYKEIFRKGVGDECVLGWNSDSWSLSCVDEAYSAWHHNMKTVLNPPERGFHRVGVYLDWPAGTLSFYSITSNAMTLLHTFHGKFKGPLYPGVWLHEPGDSVLLCNMG